MVSFLSRLLGWLIFLLVYISNQSTFVSGSAWLYIPSYFGTSLTLYIWWGIRIRLFLLAWIIQQLQLSTFNGGIFKNQKKMQPGLESILEKIKKLFKWTKSLYSVLFFVVFQISIHRIRFFLSLCFFYEVRFAITMFCCFNKGMWFLSAKNIRIMAWLSWRACKYTV